MNHQATTKGSGSYLFDDDFQDVSFDAPKPTDNETIRKEAHIANGGEATFKCPSCRGSGDFRSYTGRYVGACFKCKGKGHVSKGVIAAAKGKETKAANQAKWQADNADAIAYVRKRADKGSTFYASFLEKMAEYGTLTENQLALVHRDMAKDAEFYAKRKAEREAAAPKVEISAIEALFAKAVDNDVKRPIFRADGIEISKAPVNGRNAGALYVKANGEYAGKIVDGKFHKVYAAPADTTDRLMAVAADPLREAMAYGRKFGNCALCGRDLVDPVSIRACVGPICAPKWGLDWKRDEARESLAADKAAEEASQE
jgi:Family of unknown function (DUF6011)